MRPKTVWRSAVITWRALKFVWRRRRAREKKNQEFQKISRLTSMERILCGRRNSSPINTSVHDVIVDTLIVRSIDDDDATRRGKVRKLDVVSTKRVLSPGRRMLRAVKMRFGFAPPVCSAAWKWYTRSKRFLWNFFSFYAFHARRRKWRFFPHSELWNATRMHGVRPVDKTRPFVSAACAQDFPMAETAIE